MRGNYYYFKDLFSEEECDLLVENTLKTKEFEVATTFGGQISGVRDTKIAWISGYEERNFHDQILEGCNIANREIYGFDIYNRLYELQFSEYGIGAYYAMHTDVDWSQNSLSQRKLSTVVFLNNYNEDYSGGELIIEGVNVPLDIFTKGSLIVFPSLIPHEVRKITMGTRYTLVSWLEGPAYK